MSYQAFWAVLGAIIIVQPVHAEEHWSCAVSKPGYRPRALALRIDLETFVMRRDGAALTAGRILKNNDRGLVLAAGDITQIDIDEERPTISGSVIVINRKTGHVIAADVVLGTHFVEAPDYPKAEAIRPDAFWRGTCTPFVAK